MLDNKVALITGGGGGIGRATALAFAEQGATVLVADVDAEGGAGTVQAVEAVGGTASFITTDVTSAEEVRTMVDTAVSRYGRLDIAVNNAGVGGAMMYFQEQSEATFDQVMNINVKGVWLSMKYEIPVMLAQSNGGTIVNVSSVAGLIALPGNGPYTASKHAVVGLTRAAAVELARKAIRINAVCPSYTDTAIINDILQQQPQLESKLMTASPMRRLGTAEEIAQAIVWLASPHASFINGAILAADGGMSAM